ncbi:MAG: hypothetical protein AAF517_13815, partial [Planctomycetota bacterium]
LHEVGHLNHLHSFVEEGRGDSYWSLPTQEREQFAHRFADEAGARLRERGAIPFERILTRGELTRHGLAADWFDETV